MQYVYVSAQRKYIILMISLGKFGPKFNAAKANVPTLMSRAAFEIQVLDQWFGLMLCTANASKPWNDIHIIY